MKTSTAAVLVASALSLGCVAATGPQSLPDEVSLSRTTKAHVDVASMASEAELMQVLPPILARFGYFISEAKATGIGLRLLTDWQVRPVAQNEFAQGAKQARSRVIVDARRRGDRYAVTIYMLSFVEDAAGAWREAPASPAMRKHVQEIGTQIALDVH
jgi:hypothetical protein